MKLSVCLAVYLTGALALAASSGCRRYTTPLSDAPQRSTAILGKEEFFSVERLQRQALEQLIRTRQSEQLPATGGRYQIGPDDLLQITVFDVPELSPTVRVRPSGLITMPVVGEFHAAGNTEPEFEHKLKAALAKYLKQPSIRVFIAEYGAQKVSVIGEVNQPGVYPLKREGYSVLEVLSEAGGRKSSAGSKVVLIPAGEKNAGANAPGITIQYEDLVGTSAARINVPLRPGDTLVVPEAGTIHVDGEVEKPGSVQLASRTTLLGAIAGAGGLRYAADVERVEVFRDLGSDRKAVLTVDLEEIAVDRTKDIRLFDGDVVRVPSAGFRFATSQVVDAINQVLNIGVSGGVR